jgi:hypothetical protein
LGAQYKSYDNGCDDLEEEDDNEDEEHGEGHGMLQKECKTRWSSR